MAGRAAREYTLLGRQTRCDQRDCHSHSAVRVGVSSDPVDLSSFPSKMLLSCSPFPPTPPYTCDDAPLVSHSGARLLCDASRFGNLADLSSFFIARYFLQVEEELPPFATVNPQQGELATQTGQQQGLI